MYLAILLFAISFSNNAQQFYSEDITSADGLPNDAIRSIYEDSRGFIWVGTDAGVSRWDGNEFITYNTLDGLIGNKVWWIEEDNEHNLWFACYGAGISKFNGKKFVSYPDEDGLVDNYVRVIKYSSHHDCMAIGTNKAISVLKDSIFYNFSFENKSLKKEVIITGILDNDSSIEFYDFSSQHSRIFFKQGKPYIKTNDFDLIGKHGVSSVFEDENGDRYFGWSRNGIIKENKSSLLEMPNIGQVFGFAEDYAQRIWIASWNGGGISPPGGLFVFDNNRIESLNSAYNINSIRGWSMLSSKSQNLILYGTLDKGLYKILPTWFEYYSAAYFQESDLDILDMETDADNNLWFITDSLLVKCDGEKYEKLGFDVFYKLHNEYEVNGLTHSSFRNRLTTLNEPSYKDGKKFISIEKDRHGKIWVSIRSLGLFSFSTNSFKKIKFHPIKPMSDFIFDEADTLFQCNAWLDYLLKYDDWSQSDKIIFYKDSLIPMYAKKLAKYQNEIWAFSRINGVFFEKDGKLRTVTSEDSSISKIVNDICFDSDGFAYLAGIDGKIDILEPVTRKKVFEIYQNNNHKPITWLKVSKNMLFAGYSDGLRVYKIKDIIDGKSNYMFFADSEGYTVKIVNSSVVDKIGNIWLATNDGLIRIVTELFIECKFQPLTTVIQKVEVFNKDIDWKQTGNISSWSGLPLETPKLNPDQNHISIYFHTLNYNNPDADHYYYKLDGIDKDWIGPTDKKSAVYPFLPPDKYKFLVKSKNELSGLTTQPAEFRFVILTPWYQQLWFYILLASLVIIFFILFYNIRLRNMRKKEESKRDIMQKISELETKALQAQMNPHFLFNSINSIQGYILDNDVDEALTYLNSFSKIIRMTLEFVNTKFVRLRDVLDYLNHYVNLENMRFDDLFEYVVVIDDEIDPETTLIPPMLLQTLIENSIKHGIRHLKHKGTIKLEIAKIDNESFKCIIEDNGVGRLKSAQINKNQKIKKESLGLKIIKERLDILNNGDIDLYNMRIIDLYADNGMSAGTRVEITLAFILL